MFQPAAPQKLSQKLRDKENELSKAKERAEELHQDLIKEQSNVVRLESMVVRVKQEKSQFEKELIASQKRTEDEVSRMERFLRNKNGHDPCRCINFHVQVQQHLTIGSIVRQRLLRDQAERILQAVRDDMQNLHKQPSLESFTG